MGDISIDRRIHAGEVYELGQEPSSSGGGSTDHSHANKYFLDHLSIDSSGRLTYSFQLLAVPLHQEDW